jgi:hypothetical protein
MSARDLSRIAITVAAHSWRGMDENAEYYTDADEKHVELCKEIATELGKEDEGSSSWFAHLRKNPALRHPMIPDWILRFKSLNDEVV